MHTDPTGTCSTGEIKDASTARMERLCMRPSRALAHSKRGRRIRIMKLHLHRPLTDKLQIFILSLSDFPEAFSFNFLIGAGLIPLIGAQCAAAEIRADGVRAWVVSVLREPWLPYSRGPQMVDARNNHVHEISLVLYPGRQFPLLPSFIFAAWALGPLVFCAFHWLDILFLRGFAGFAGNVEDVRAWVSSVDR
ncbi:hypothetical protein IQ06DRAFT_129620 [Phaeosphaeriaceae sp. SRC1lsM3a]|nr:hypothetical protein IQ06DRAFT_129620 [Stagonospora sp. SRC1lsM3a]